MITTLELLQPALLKDKAVLRDVDWWLSVMGRPNGWHYDLDIAWILAKLKAANVHPGQTVLDAGAGLGVMQYVLASRGYNVISLDFARRALPSRARGIFDIKVKEGGAFTYTHEYMKHMIFDGSSCGEAALQYGVLRKAGDWRNWPFYLSRAREIVQGTIANAIEKTKDHGTFGVIEFQRASFHDIPLSSGSCDAAVSVSAIEHADKKLLPDVVKELSRVVKAGGPVLLTTSATDTNHDVFHEPTQGWCFSPDTLASLFDTRVDFSGFSRTERDLLKDPLLWSRMHESYRRRGGLGLFPSRAISRLPYLPVGIELRAAP